MLRQEHFARKQQILYVLNNNCLSGVTLLLMRLLHKMVWSSAQSIPHTHKPSNNNKSPPNLQLLNGKSYLLTSISMTNSESSKSSTTHRIWFGVVFPVRANSEPRTLYIPLCEPRDVGRNFLDIEAYDAANFFHISHSGLPFKTKAIDLSRL